MKKLFVLLCLVSILSFPVLATETEVIYGEDELDFSKEWNFGGKMGFTVGYFLLNQGTLKTEMEAAGYPVLNDGMMVFGSNSSFGLKDGIRWGGFGFGGATQSTGSNDALSQLDFGVGGMNVDYGYTLGKQAEITMGLMAGIGGYELTLRKGALEDITQPNKIHLMNVFFVAGPQVNLQYKVNDWFALQGTIGYLFGLGNKNWLDVDDRTEIVPGLGINGAMVGVSGNIVF